MNILKNENGYVLVVIIGILTILSLMTITFATLSRIETRATRNYTDSVKCEKIAKAALEHAIYEIRLDKFGTDTLAYNDDDNGNYGLDEHFDSSGTSWPGDSVFPNTGTDDYDNDGNGADDSTWIYFPAAASTADIRLPGNVRARYAVLITDDREARININITGNKAGGGSHTSNEGWSTFEIDLSDLIEREVGNGITIANLITDARHGSDSNPGNAGDDDPGKIPDPQNDVIDNDGDSIIDEAGEDINEPNEFNSISPIGDDVPFGLLSEAEIIGTSSYESRLEEKFTTGGISPEDQGAFKDYLTTYSADTILCPPYPLDSGTSTTRLNINALFNNEGPYTGGYYNSDRKVKMLIDVLTAGGVTDIERQQIAVNIKDFIDPDGTSTTYLDVSSGFTYYGVDKGTPYINEVEAQPSGSNPKFIELYNPYDENLPTTGGWTIRLDAGTTIIALPAASVPAGGYYVIGDSSASGVDQVEPTIANLDSGGEELRLRDNNGIDVQVTDYGSAGDNDTRSLNDPRPIPLTTGDPLDPWSWATTENSIGLPNDNLPAVGNDDGWDGVTYPSSFFIANRRFSNKGYLGFIHRGRQWSSFKVDDTIAYPNVLQYFTVSDPSMDGIDNDGDGSTDSADTGSQSGDLDGPEYRIPGLINVNTAPSEVLQSLPNIDSTIGDAIDTPGNKPYTSIGDLLAKVPEITGAIGTKWVEEEALRSISNLITVRSNVFTVYVTAQITDEAMSNVFAEKRLIAIVDRSVDPIKVRYFRWLVE